MEIRKAYNDSNFPCCLQNKEHAIKYLVQFVFQYLSVITVAKIPNWIHILHNLITFCVHAWNSCKVANAVDIKNIGKKQKIGLKCWRRPHFLLYGVNIIMEVSVRWLWMDMPCYKIRLATSHKWSVIKKPHDKWWLSQKLLPGTIIMFCMLFKKLFSNTGKWTVEL